MGIAVVFLPLSRGMVSVIDFDDFEKVGRIKWKAQRRGRGGLFHAAQSVRNTDGSQTTRYLHQILYPSWKRTDHKNGDGLDNRKENLRECSHQQNLRAYCRKRAGASSLFRGVSRYARDQKWQASIRVNGRSYGVGVFVSEADAARAYDKAAMKFGFEKEALNFPGEW